MNKILFGTLFVLLFGIAHPQGIFFGVQGPRPRQCSTVCAQVYKPVCGIFGRSNRFQTFSNRCELQAEACKNTGSVTWLFGYDGECRGNQNPSPPQCNTVCSYDYTPVCASWARSNRFQTFSNRCELQADACKNPGSKWVFVNDGECPTDQVPSPPQPQCGTACPTVYTPVCASWARAHRFKTFSNRCELQVDKCRNPGSNWSFVSNGECRPDQEPKPQQCNTVCPAVYTPVCASWARSNRFRTFANMCELQAEKCRNPDSNWRFSKNGACRAGSIGSTSLQLE